MKPLCFGLALLAGPAMAQVNAVDLARCGAIDETGKD